VAERLTVAQEVAGSIPVAHPIFPLKIAAAVLLVLGIAAPADAQQLTFTTRFQERMVSWPSSPPPRDAGRVGAVLEPILTRSEERTELTTTVSDAGVRTEIVRGGFVEERDRVVLHRAYGDIVVLRPSDQSFWNYQARVEPATRLEFSARRTGQFSTLAGARCERVALTFAGVRESMLNGEACVAPSHEDHARRLQSASRANPLVESPVLADIDGLGFVLRLVLRGEALRGLEFERVVTAISEGPLVAGLFELPAGYRTVPPPPTFDPDVTRPKLLRRVDPMYTPAGMQARVRGTVKLAATVQPDGTVSDIVVVESLDKRRGLDEAAIAALRQWRFEPARRAGQPIPFRIHAGMTFRLRF
jgi:TonB family protein